MKLYKIFALAVTLLVATFALASCQETFVQPKGTGIDSLKLVK